MLCEGIMRRLAVVLAIIPLAACHTPNRAAALSPLTTTCDLFVQDGFAAPTPRCENTPLSNVERATRQAVPECNRYTERLQRCYAHSPAAAVLAARQNEAFEPIEQGLTYTRLSEACGRDVARLEAFCPRP